MTSPQKSSTVKDRCVAQSPDMKAMCALMGQLEALKQSSSNRSPPKPLNKSRQVQDTTFKRRNRMPRKPSKYNDYKQKNNIRDWLVSETEKQNDKTDKNSNLKSPKKGKEVYQNSAVKSSAKWKKISDVKIKSPKKHGMSSSYLRYGVKIPSFNNIMKKCAEAEEYIKSVEANKLESYTEMCQYKNQTKTVDKNREILDCKHLTLKEIQKAFERNLTYIKQIQSGEVHSERHDAFLKQQHQVHFNKQDDLRCDTSTITFSDKQIWEMLKMLKSEFDNKTQYFLMVLLPELCLKIFMEEHEMSHDEALEYLRELPDSDDSDSD